MRAVALASVALASLALLAPAASAAAAPTTLHLYVDPLADFPITPQAPPDSFSVNSAVGLAGSTFTCADNPPLARPFASSHTMRGYAYPEPVEVTRGEAVKFHPSRGVDGDVVFSGETLLLHWYWAVDPVPGAPGGEQAQAVLPNVVVEATLRAGNAISIDDSAYDQGEVVASGSSGPAVLAGPLTQGATYEMVGGQAVYEFTVPLALAAPLVPRDQGFNLRVDTYMAECGDGRVMPHAVSLHSSPGHRPRIEAAVVDPLGGTLVGNVLPDGTLVAYGVPTSVLGTGDVANVTLTVTGPDGPVEMDDQDSVAEGYGPCGHECGHRLTFNYLRVLPNAPAGRYDIAMTFTNQQGTATHTLTHQVDVAQEQEAPGPALPVLAAGLLAVALALRRRR